jgi:heterotetrameric sarcosine oxidase delta subunit
MLRLDCPVCGLRDETEFVYGGDATKVRPPLGESEPSVWLDFVFLRDNPRGIHREYWHHALGCRQWIIQERNTLTHDRSGSQLAKDFSR